MAAEIIVRQATAEDWPFIRTIHRANETSLGPLWYWCRDFKTGGMPNLSDVWVAAVGSTLIGFVRRVRTGGVPRLESIIVHKDWRRKGAAKALVCALPRPFEVHTDVGNSAARALYESLGGKFGGTYKAKRSKRELVIYYIV